MSRRIGAGEIGLVVFGLVLALGLVGVLEWVVRAQLDVYRCDARLGWTFRPSSSGIKLNRHGEFFHRVHFNAVGFNDDAWPDPSADVFRILLLGDSFAASLQVPRRAHFASRTEALLNEHVLPGRRIEIMNAGVDGYGTAQELLLLREIAPRYEPDLLLLQMFIQNDVTDNFHAAGDWNHYLANRCGRPYFQEVDGGVALYALPEPYESSGWDRLLRHSKLYAALIAPPQRDEREPAVRIADNYAVDPPDSWRDAWKLTQRLTLAVRKEARQNGMGFAVLVAPTKQSVGQLREVHRARGWPLERWQQGHALLISYLRERGLLHVDLLPPLRRFLVGTGTPPYFERDDHWNADGHEVVAKAVYRALMDHCKNLRLPIRGCESSAGGRLPGQSATPSAPPGPPVR